ncbi:MAG: RidA family protein [Bacteroidota bacterium]
MEILQSPNIPVPKGHYSPAISHNGLLYISGQLPYDPENQSSPEGIEAQTLATLEKMDVLLREAGTTRSKVLQCRIYISDVNLWGKVNEVYASFFGNHKPVRCVVPVNQLHYGCLIEIEALAVIE